MNYLLTKVGPSMPCDAVKGYFNSPTMTPFFLFVSDRKYRNIVNTLSLQEVTFKKLSDFCNDNDKLPDIDRLYTYITHMSDTGEGEKRLIILGLGEYLAIRGNYESWSVLSKLKDLNVSPGKVVLLLRGLGTQIEKLKKSDPRFDDRRYCVVDGANCNLSLTLTKPFIGFSAINGFKSMLKKFEDGCSDNFIVNTSIIDVEKSLFNVQLINDAYDGVWFSTKGFDLKRSWGEDTYWTELLSEMNNSGGKITSVFNQNGITANFESEFYNRIAGTDYQNWLYFIYLKYKLESIQNPYLRFVIENTDRFEDVIANVLSLINKVSLEDVSFPVFYNARKILTEKFPESDIADFVVNNRKIEDESIFRLTDVTRTEKEEIIAWISRHRIIPKIKEIYPALFAYLKKYVFKCPVLADLFTEYFDDYKKQKLSNSLEDTFIEKVNHLAEQPRVFYNGPMI